jgi:hypothetical protein
LRRGGRNSRGGFAPSRYALSLDKGAFKRSEAPLPFLLPLEQNEIRVTKISLFERGIKGVSVVKKQMQI